MSGWRFCGRCFTMFWDRDADKGRCAAGGRHNAQGVMFVLPSNRPETAVGQTAWRYCRKCRGIYFNGFDTHGVCPGGGAHGRLRPHADGSRTDPNYLLNHDLPEGETATSQRTWFFCRKCFGLFYGGFPSQGVCAAGGGHDREGSFEFMLAHAPVASTGFGDDNVAIPVNE